MSKHYGLYIHIPLCKSKCRYCDFYKVTPKQWIGTDLFLDALEKEFKGFPNNFSPVSIFIGGGTPSALSSKEFFKLLKLIHKYVNLDNIIEWTCEANPSSLDSEKMNLMHRMGINRLSIGVQSFNDKSLKLLGRNHDSEKAIHKINEARSIGFDKLNIDLIQSIPGMSDKEIEEDLECIKKILPDHISYYNLIYEKGTPLTHDKDNGKLKLFTDEKESDIYFYIKEYLSDIGYRQYEISNYSLNNNKSLHNLLYWKGDEYIGCGPSAHSHWNGERYSNVNNLSKYYEKLMNDESIIEIKERLPSYSKAKETFVMWLRLNEGVNILDFEEKVNVKLKNLYTNEIDELIDKNFLIKQFGNIKIPDNKKFLSDYVFSELI